MATIEALFVAVFDAKNADFAVLGHPDMRFAGEFEARRAGCIVMPQGPRVGEIQGASSTEIVVTTKVEPALTMHPRAPGPRVISMVPGSVQRPAPVQKPEADVPQKLPRTWRR